MFDLKKALKRQADGHWAGAKTRLGLNVRIVHLLENNSHPVLGAVDTEGKQWVGRWRENGYSDKEAALENFPDPDEISIYTGIVREGEYVSVCKEVGFERFVPSPGTRLKIVITQLMEGEA